MLAPRTGFEPACVQLAFSSLENWRHIGAKGIAMEVTCFTCLKIFNKRPSEIKRSPRHFCSHSCAASTNNIGVRRHKIKPKKQHILLNSSELKLLTISDYHSKPSVVGKHPSWINSHIRALNRSWNKDLRKLPCQVCSYSNHIELAHIKAISSFDKITILGEVNHPSNILVLCPNHHWEFDNGILLMSNIPPR